MKSSGIGGQAVLEGIMMKNGDAYAVAVRTSQTQVALRVDEYRMFSSTRKWAQKPILRGIFNFVDSMVLGIQTLTYSANVIEEGPMEEEPSDEEILKHAGEPGPTEEEIRAQKKKERMDKMMMGVTVAVSLVMAVGIFMVLPVILASFFRRFIQSSVMLAFLEGVVRIVIFLGYVLLISRMEDIRRVFMYHGAEHKCINCIEHGMDLTVENVMKSSRLHKRCGTSFLLIVMLISVVFFMIVRVENLWLRILTRILLVPLIAGVSYEFIRLAGTRDTGWVNALSKPGLWLQKLTTREPDETMVQVAIMAVEAVFDWRNFLAENF